MKLCSSNAPIVKHQKTMRSSTHVSGSRFQALLTQVCSAVVAIILPAYALAQNAGGDVCTRAVTGSEVSAPTLLYCQTAIAMYITALLRSLRVKLIVDE